MDNTALIAIGLVGAFLLFGSRGPARHAEPSAPPAPPGAPELPRSPSGGEIARDIVVATLESADDIIRSIAAYAEASATGEE